MPKQRGFAERAELLAINKLQEECLRQEKKHIVFGDKIDVYPESVKAISKVMAAFANYDREIKPENEEFIRNIITGFRKQIDDFMRDTKSMDKNGPPYQARLATFNQGCKDILATNYKYAAAEPSLWNAFKDLVNWAWQAVGGKKPLVTLDANEFSNSTAIKNELRALKQTDIKLPTSAEEVDNFEDENNPAPG